MWAERLEMSGVKVTMLDSKHVRLDDGTQSDTFQVVQANGRVQPSDVGPKPDERSLLVADTLSAEAELVARKHHWSVVTKAGPSWVDFGNAIRELETDAQLIPGEHRAARRGRPGFSTSTVLRTLLSIDGPLRQAELAEFAHVSQARVSQSIKQLREANLVARQSDGWTVLNRHLAIDWWLDVYSGPGGLRSHWYGLDSPFRQCFEVVRLLTRLKADPVVSGDVAADLVAPWRVPSQGLVYARVGADLTEIGLTPSPERDSTLTLCLPNDPAVWPVGTVPHQLAIEGMGSVNRASALQILWDLKHGRGTDAIDAADAWEQLLLKSQWATP